MIYLVLSFVTIVYFGIRKNEARQERALVKMLCFRPCLRMWMANTSSGIRRKRRIHFFQLVRTRSILTIVR